MNATVTKQKYERSGPHCSGPISRTVPGPLFAQPLNVVVVLFSLLAASLAYADKSESGGLKLLELYTSLGCSSCPPADKLLGELLEKEENLLALEFHVDYWNHLVHGDDGSFVDPFSKPEFSHRQRQYNSAKLGGRPGVYTPQAIINGRFAAVGSNKKHIVKALSRPVDQYLDITFSATSDAGKLSVLITGSADRREALAGVGIMLARYIDEATTPITGGENKNRTITNHNIVTELTRLGTVTEAGNLSFMIASPAANEGCVILVQEGAMTPVFAAAGCP